MYFHGWLARAQKHPFALMGGQSLLMSVFGRGESWSPSNPVAWQQPCLVASDRGDDVRRDQREHVC